MRYVNNNILTCFGLVQCYVKSNQISYILILNVFFFYCFAMAYCKNLYPLLGIFLQNTISAPLNLTTKYAPRLGIPGKILSLPPGI